MALTIGPTLETERLILRPPSLQDLDAWSAFMANEESTRYLGGIQPRSAVWRGITCMAGAWALEGFAMFSVIEKSSGRWIGRLGPWRPEGWPGSEIGWGIIREAEGRGYATEGAKASMHWAFETLGWQEVIHTILPDNQSSKTVAGKLGSRYLRMDRLPAPMEHFEVEVWGQTREQWQTRQSHPNSR